MLITAEQWYAGSVTASGVVVDYQTGRVKIGTEFAELVGFSSSSGQEIIFTDSTSSSSPHPIGAVVPLRSDYRWRMHHAHRSCDSNAFAPINDAIATPSNAPQRDEA